MTRLTPAEFFATVDKIEKINARAAKRGFTGRLAVDGQRVEVTSSDALGFTRTEVFFEATLSGEAPSYGGWTFLARVDTVGDTFTLATAPGVDHIDRTDVRPGECDHCGANRNRKTTYLVVNEQTGTRMNVGSTCIKDFLGWDGGFVFYGDADVNLEEFSGCFQGERTYSLDTVLAYAYAAIRAFGWVPASAYDGTPTVSYVRMALFGGRLSLKDQLDIDTLRHFASEAEAKVEDIRNFILSDKFTGTSNYVENLKAACSVPFITNRQIGLITSAPQAYARFLEGEAVRKAKPEINNEPVGQVKDKVTVTGTIEAIRYIEHGFGTTVLYTIVTDDHRMVKWFASREALGEDTGRKVTITGTVKDHEEYRGIKSTVLTRCKEVVAA